jgi:glycosyltransferase involved in cell wall biosynthesis
VVAAPQGVRYEASVSAELDSRRCRVARIIDRLNVGGPAKHVTWLTVGLGERGFATTLITGCVPAGEGDMAYFAAEAGITPLVIDSMSRELTPRDVIVAFKLFGVLRRVQPAIVHTHKAKAGAVGRIAAWLYRWSTPSALILRPRRCAIVHTYHGHVFHGYFGALKSWAIVAIERLLARTTDRILVVSEQQRSEICGRFGVGRPEQFRVVPLGIDVEEPAPAPGSLRRELGFNPATPLVAIVGRLSEVKNHAMFLDAAGRVLAMEDEACRAARFVVVGDGHLRADLEARAIALGLADCVTFTGFRKDAMLLYADFDVVALTSLNEGTPMTLIEAMRSGRAVLSTEVGGVVDILGARGPSLDGFTVWDHGVTVPSGDVQALARGLRYLLLHPDVRREMGERGRRFVTGKLSVERLLDDIETLYRELLESASVV